MRNRVACLIAVLAAVPSLSFAVRAQTARPSGTAASQATKALPFDPHDLSGVWWRRGKPPNGKAGMTLSINPPPMTAWALARYNANIPTGGSTNRIQALGNDPMVTCDPVGFPRVMFYDAYPYEIVQVPGRMFQFFDYFYTHRVIWTDGRELPKDPDPTWYGSAVGKWDGNTFVVDSFGFDDRSWLDQDGHPHSDEMRLQERYQRVDHDTLQDVITLTDPKAYTKPWVSDTETWTLSPKMEIHEDLCVPSDEAVYKKEMREPAAVAPGK